MSLGVLVKIANRLHISLDYLVLGKTRPTNDLIADAGEDTYVTEGQDKNRDLANLISMCSPQELDLIEKLIKVILPYVRQ